ncbi:ATP-grasp domain-containing protein [Mycoplasmatota bacterium]|nr:ATP-grasp domain-containing protein [Mycoplasmatota bacterium]
MKTIIFIGTQKSGSSREAIKAAQDLGFFTVLFTNKKKNMVQREEFMDVHIMRYCDLNDVEAMKTMIKQLELKAFDIKAIVSFVDSYIYTACRLAEEYAVNHFTTNAIYQMENKVLSRELMKHSTYSPQFKVLEHDMPYTKDEITKILPCIVKSPQSTGSKDVYKIKNYDQYKQQVKNLRKKYPKQKILIEEYLEGPQYLVEVLVIRGLIHIIGIVEQDISLINHHFIVTGYNLVINPSVSLYQPLKRAISDIIYLHGMKNGACHLELRYVNGIWKLIEINPRISGGGMNQLIKAGYGIDLTKETLKLALNQYVDIKPKYKKHAYIQYITVPKAGTIETVTGKKRAMQKKGVIKVYIKPRKGNIVCLPKSMGNRYAYVLATGENKEKAIQNAKSAIKEIHFKIRS